MIESLAINFFNFVSLRKLATVFSRPITLSTPSYDEGQFELFILKAILHTNRIYRENGFEKVYSQPYGTIAK